MEIFKVTGFVREGLLILKDNKENRGRKNIFPSVFLDYFQERTSIPNITLLN